MSVKQAPREAPMARFLFKPLVIPSVEVRTGDALGTHAPDRRTRRRRSASPPATAAGPARPA